MTMQKLKSSAVLFGIGALLLSGCTRSQVPPESRPPESSASVPARIPESIQTTAEDLTIPWDIAFLGSGDFLVTERAGTLLWMGSHVRQTIAGVRHIGEGGLLGITLHPDFGHSQWIYLYLTTEDGEGLRNRVERYTWQNGKLTERTEIVSGIPGAIYHDGGRIEFGPDGYLYITTGDATSEGLAQQTDSLAGKILRVKDDGSIPEDNPFGNAVYSYGHRNPQGLAWDGAGRLWSTEHGRSGVRSGYDEINKIDRGKNYGWPVIQGSETKEGMESPVLHSGANDTWAPASLAFNSGSLFFGGLRAEALYEFRVSDQNPVLRKHFVGEYGRLRTIRLGPDGYFYILTSNRDGRGSPESNDDRIVKIHPSALK